MNYPSKVVKNDRLKEEYTYVKHPSGLDIFIWKKDGFSTTDAYFGTKYGSINTRFKTDEDDDFIEVPEGIAHFLEHKLFENEDCDVFDLYAKTGANANAFTSFDQTVYLFNCTENYLESLHILLSFVQKPYFTQETVDKEQGIIGQEIKMCQDSPGREAFIRLLSALYKNHPVKIDIAGTVESIAQIDADLLYRCYRTFYNLNNMMLCVAGNVDVEDIIKVCDEELVPCKNVNLQKSFPEEPLEVAQKETVKIMPVSTPIFQIGLKCPPKKGQELIKASVACDFIMKLLMGASTDFYNSLMEEGLINSQFSTELFYGEDYFSCICGGESKDPKEVLSRIKAEIERVKSSGFDSELFEILKKSKYGGYVKALESSEACAGMMLFSSFLDVDAFAEIECIANISLEEVTEIFKEYFNTDNMSISIVKPN